MTLSRRARLAGGMLLLATSAAQAELPLWELGAGLGGASLPAYRGSDEQFNYLLPIPYFIYRGERFSMDRRGIRGMLLTTDGVELNVSGDFGVPVNSDGNDAREGMDDLDFVAHLGPSLEFTLHEEPEHGDYFKVILPAQAVIGLNVSEPGVHGWVFFPHVNYVMSGRWSVGMSAGPVFATRDYHQYYYGVGAADATAQRPEYSAKGGYTGARFSMSIARRIGDAWFGAYLRYEDLSGAAYGDSPLVRRDDSFVAGFGISWVLMHSQRAARDTSIPDPESL